MEVLMSIWGEETEEITPLVCGSEKQSNDDIRQSLPCPKKRIYLLFSQSLKKLYSYSEIGFLLFTPDIKIVKNNIVWGGVLDVSLIEVRIMLILGKCHGQQKILGFATHRMSWYQLLLYFFNSMKCNGSQRNLTQCVLSTH